jgi:recombination protein RecA
MSSAVLSTSAALGRPFIFGDEADPEALQGSCGDSRPQLLALSEVEGSARAKLDRNEHSAKILPASVVPASRLGIRPAPEMVTSGIPALDALTGGLPRGCLTEICGPASSGRTTVLLAALAAATQRGEYCAVIDANDALDPYSLAAAEVNLDRVLWVRCGVTEKSCRKPDLKGHGFSRAAMSSPTRNPSEYRLEQVLLVTDLLLESGGFGLILLDLADLPPEATRRIPLTTWFRFRRAVEHKPTILLAIEQQPIAGSCSSLLLQLGVANPPAAKRRKKTCTITGMPPARSSPSHANLLTALEIHAELIRSRLDRKPAQSITFETKTAWAG